MLTTILSAKGLYSLVAVLLTAVFRFIWKFARNKGISDGVVDAMRDAVAIVQDDFVVFAKRASADGKLSKEERTEAKNLAIQHAKDIAKGPVLKALMSYGTKKLGALATRIVQGNKK